MAIDRLAPDPGARSVEREAKLDADQAFEVPDLGALVTVVPLPDRHLRAAYFDTPDLRLWARGITVRHRVEDPPAEGSWTVKLPAGDAGLTLDRTELNWRGPRTDLPGDAAEVLRGVVRHSALQAIAELDTTRRRLALHDLDGTPVAELDDDVVTVLGGGQNGSSFRQIELELANGGSELAGPVLRRLRDAGAVPNNQPKLARALGLAAPGPAGPGAEWGRRATVEDLVRDRIGAGLDQLLDHDYRLRLDPADPPVHSIHQARVATRRLRSDLKLLAVLLDPAWVGPVRDELGWLGALLGRVRDSDVLADHLQPDGLGPSVGAVGRRELLATLGQQRREQCRDLAAALAGERYLNLLDRLAAAIARPPLVRPSGAGRVPSGEDPAIEVLPGLVRHRWKLLRRQVRASGPRPTDRELHRTRIRSKELRYAAETAIPLVGTPARRLAYAAERVQTVLGDHHDAVGAEAWLEAAALNGTPVAAYAAGRLAAEQVRAQHTLRRRWRSAWHELDDPWLRRWL
ncbi:MAG: CHAD domain-containing protein [Acidimicrobiales bacterium]